MENFTKKNFSLYCFTIKRNNKYCFKSYYSKSKINSDIDYSGLIYLNDGTKLTNYLYIEYTLNELFKLLNKIDIYNYTIINMRLVNKWITNSLIEVQFQEKYSFEELIKIKDEEITLLREQLNGQNPSFEPELDIINNPPNYLFNKK